LEVQGLRELLDAKSVPKKELHLANAQKRNSPTYLPLNILKKMAIIFPHNNNNLILTMQAIDADDVGMYYLHLIVLKVGSEEAQFNFDGMLNCLESASFGNLREQLTTRYVPWLNTNAAIIYRRLNNIILIVPRMMLQGMGVQGHVPLQTHVIRNTKITYLLLTGM
jgi:hypothetical protein